jgi:tetratricopeptide (TPR) repeat protein
MPTPNPSTSKPGSPKTAAAPLPEHPLLLAAPRLVLTTLAGLLGLLVCRNFLSDEENTAFLNFLSGQSGFDGMLTSSVFWKMLVAFVLGGAGAHLIGTEIPPRTLQKLKVPALAVALFLISVIIYIPAMSAGFIWDDDQEITANTSIMNINDPRSPNWYGLWEIWTGGLTNVYRPGPGVPEPKPDPLWVAALRPRLRAIEKAIWPETKFVAHESADYFPLKTTMLWLEYNLFGKDPRGGHVSYGYHTMNIIVHAIDALLLWMVLAQLRVPGAWLGALLFAVHPVHAESVAWIAERKNTLSLTFYLLSISAWIKFEDRWKKAESLGQAWASGGVAVFLKSEGFLSGVYLASLLYFVGSLLCKTHVVVLPAVLLLLTWWRTGRLTLRDFARSVPFFIVALSLAIVTIWFQNGRAIGQEVIPIGDFWSRLAGAGLAIWWYISKAIVPINLNTIYEFIGPFGATWPLKPQAWMYLFGAAAAGLLAALWFAQKKIGRTPFLVYAYFLGTLFPVLGFFKMSYMRLTLVADHFQYLSDISVVAFAGAGIAIAWKKLAGARRTALVAACVLLVGVFCAYSWERAGVHQSEKTLWTACLKKNDNSWQAHNHLGAVIYMEGNILAAQYHFQRAVDLKPENPEVHNNLGLTFAYQNRWEEALAQYRRAVEIKGDVPAMRRNLADCLATMGRLEEAAEQYKIVVDADKRDPNARGGYGYVLSRLNRLEESKAQFEAALAIDPTNARVRQNLEIVRNALGRK